MSLIRPKADDVFEPDRASRQLEARRRNWRPVIAAGLVVGGLSGVYVTSGPVWNWLWPEKLSAREPKPAFNAAGMTGFHHPDIKEPEQKIVEVPVDKPVPVMVEVPKLLEMAPPPTPAPPPVEIEKIRPSWQMAFMPSSPPSDPYMADGRRHPEAWGCAIRPGLNVIKATLVDDVRWDYGGPISARVEETVYSPEALAIGERRVLIPQGAVLLGTGDPTSLKRGMDLAAGPIWTEVNFTDTMGMPRSIKVFDAQGAGASGINAIGGDVDQRWGEIALAAGFFTVLETLSSVRINVNLGNDSENVSSSGVTVSGSPAASIGQEVVKSMLDWRPIIFTPKGQKIILKPTRAIRVC